MKPKILLAALLLALLPVSGLGQSRPAPLTRPEILGRLAVGQPPSTIAYSVKIHGIEFSISEDFLSRVKLAGGDGILVERLSITGLSEFPAPNAGLDGSYEHLAECAELLHSGDAERAKDECWASMDEFPTSPWPILATLRALDGENMPEEEKVQLIRRTAALIPNPAVAQAAISGEFPLEESLAELANPTVLDSPAQRYIFGPPGVRFYVGVPPGLSTVSVEASPGDENQVNPWLQYLLERDSDLASTHAFLAYYYQQAENPQKAASEFQEALRLEPDNAELHGVVALFHESQQNFEEEIAELREVVRIVPYGFGEREELARVLESQGRTDEAIREWRELTGLSPGDERASEALAALYIQQKDWKSAVAEYKRFLEVKPDSPVVENDLAWTYATSPDPQYRKPAEALAIAKRAVETSKEPVPALIDTLAEAQLINGYPEEALKTEEQAAELAPYDAQIQSRLERFQQAAEQANSGKPH
jgi:Tfp pilus assembly protein PilF